VKAEVEAALEEVRPHLQLDGGDVELVEVQDNGIVKVRLTGSCAGCPMSQMTLKWGVENYLKKKIPEVKAVESV
jgi:Fe-S cluster biogenesis protein NfuA